MIREGLDDCVQNMLPVKFELPNKDRVELFVQHIGISQPTVPPSFIGVVDKNIYPSECRQRAASYTAMCVVRMGWLLNGVEMQPIERDMGEIPVMVKSDLCHLSKLKPKELIDRGEHENEWGGYFVVKGHEKIIRMLLMTRKNYPIAVKRSTWRDRGSHFSDIGILLRSVKTDQTATVLIQLFKS